MQSQVVGWDVIWSRFVVMQYYEGVGFLIERSRDDCVETEESRTRYESWRRKEGANVGVGDEEDTEQRTGSGR